MYKHTYSQTHICTYTYMWTCTYTRIHAHTYTYAWIRTPTHCLKMSTITPQRFNQYHRHTYASIYICIHIHIYMHIHICTPCLSPNKTNLYFVTHTHTYTHRPGYACYQGKSPKQRLYIHRISKKIVCIWVHIHIVIHFSSTGVSVRSPPVNHTYHKTTHERASLILFMFVLIHSESILNPFWMGHNSDSCFFPPLYFGFWFLVCYATTQPATPLHQRRIQVVRSNKVARKHLRNRTALLQWTFDVKKHANAGMQKRKIGQNTPTK